MFEQIRWFLDNMLGLNGDAFTMRVNASPENIETCNGVAVKDETTRTCALCVALNDTVFKNDNKPEYYHPNCKCKIKEYNLREVKLDFPIEKITHYLFVNTDKTTMMKTMGYISEDSVELYVQLQQIVKEKFTNGNYSLGLLNLNGQHFAIKFILQGKRDHVGEKFNCHIGCVAYPTGKIKIATPLIKEK